MPKKNRKTTTVPLPAGIKRTSKKKLGNKHPTVKWTIRVTKEVFNTRRDAMASFKLQERKKRNEEKKKQQPPCASHRTSCLTSGCVSPEPSLIGLSRSNTPTTKAQSVSRCASPSPCASPQPSFSTTKAQSVSPCAYSPSPCASPQPSFFALSNTPTTSHRTKMFSHSPNSPFKPLSLPSSPAWLMEGIPDDVPGLSHDSFAEIGMGITPPRQRSDHFHSGLSPLESMSPPRQLFSSSKLENEMGCDETSW